MGHGVCFVFDSELQTVAHAGVVEPNKVRHNRQSVTLPRCTGEEMRVVYMQTSTRGRDGFSVCCDARRISDMETAVRLQMVYYGTASVGPCTLIP
jgi:hypothetical protein